MGHKGHWGEYTGNTKWSKDHAHTRVTKEDYKASERDDAAHIDYLKRDVDYDDKHGHSDEDMTADEKHISKLAGDMKYDKEHHGSPAHAIGSPLYKRPSSKPSKPTKPTKPTKPSKPSKPSGTKPKPQLPPDSPVHIEGSYNMHKEANPEQYKRADNFYKHVGTAEHHKE